MMYFKENITPFFKGKIQISPVKYDLTNGDVVYGIGEDLRNDLESKGAFFIEINESDIKRHNPLN